MIGKIFIRTILMFVSALGALFLFFIGGLLVFAGMMSGEIWIFILGVLVGLGGIFLLLFKDNLAKWIELW